VTPETISQLFIAGKGEVTILTSRLAILSFCFATPATSSASSVQHPRFQMSKMMIGVSHLMKELQTIIDEEEASDNEAIEKTADQLNP